MAENKPVTIRYSYRHNDHHWAAIRHAFNYISAISGLKFIEDETIPDIWKEDGRVKPVSAKLIINRVNGESRIVQTENAASSDSCRKIDYDPIEKIIKKLSLAAKFGPYSQEHYLPPSKSESSLSEIIKAFIGLLSDAGLVAKGTRGVSLWPHGFKFGMAISHDIDIAHRSVLGGVRILLKNALPGRISAIIDSAISSLGLKHNPYDAVAEWLKLEKELEIKSTYFIFAGKRNHEDDPKYELKRLSNSIVKIKSNGFEIALHTSIGSFEGHDFENSKSCLEEFCGIKINGLRPHYLSASFPEYWREDVKTGFEYSSSLGFDNDIGFFDGLDLPFYPYDKTIDKPMNLLEIPIAIMDCGLIGNNNANSDAVFEKGKALIDRAVSSGGLIVLDWHQRTFYNRDYPGWFGLFLRLMQYAKEAGGYFTDMAEMVKMMKCRMENQI